MTTPPLLHQMQLPVRWGDMDSLGHVNNAAYLRYFEEARIVWMLSLGQALDVHSTGMILKKASVTYHRPLAHPATVRIDTHPGHIGRTSFTLVCALHQDGAAGVACDGEFVIVWFDYVQQRPAPLPDWLRDRLSPGRAA